MIQIPRNQLAAIQIITCQYSFNFDSIECLSNEALLYRKTTQIIKIEFKEQSIKTQTRPLKKEEQTPSSKPARTRSNPFIIRPNVTKEKRE